MLRRLAATQPPAFAFTPANLAWAEAQIAKYPEGRQASAVIPLLWRAQEQEGWLSRPAIEEVARMLGMAYIRALEVATFYFMFQLSPVGAVAHVQVCGTLSCMLMGAEDLVGVCERRIGRDQHHPSADGRLSWEEVECLGACANAPMVQIGKDYYEDLTPERLDAILDEMLAGRVPVPGPQNGRYAAEPEGGATTLTQWVEGRMPLNASAALAAEIGDTIKRIDGTEVPLVAPWRRSAEPEVPPEISHEEVKAAEPRPAEGAEVDHTGVTEQEATETEVAKPVGPSNPDPDLAPAAPPTPSGGQQPPGAGAGSMPGPLAPKDAPLVAEQPPATLTAPRDGLADDLSRLVGPEAQALLNGLGIHHFDQIAAWGPGEIAWVESRLGPHRGRIEGEDWVDQARRLAGEG